MFTESAGLNEIEAENSENKYFCLTCCSNTRTSSAIKEMWDLSCQTSDVDYIRMNIGRCKEFRVLRNRDLYDQEVLHCRAYRETEVWEPPKEVYETAWYTHRTTFHKEKLMKLIHTGDVELNRTVDGVENVPGMGECNFPEARNKNDIWAIRGYTLTLYVEEMDDGFNHWRQVHDCEVVVDEKPHQTTATAKSDIYERIIFLDFKEKCKELGRCDEIAGAHVSSFMIIVFMLVTFTCGSFCTKKYRDETCIVCNRQLTFSRHKCFWCKWYDADEFDPEVLAKMKAKDADNRGDIKDTELTLKERWRIGKETFEKSMFGYRKEEIVVIDNDFRSQVGVRKPKKNKILPKSKYELGSAMQADVTRRERFDLSYQRKMKAKYVEKIYAAAIDSENKAEFDEHGILVLQDEQSHNDDDDENENEHSALAVFQERQQRENEKKAVLMNLNEEDEHDSDDHIKDYEFDAMDAFAAMAAGKAAEKLSGVIENNDDEDGDDQKEGGDEKPETNSDDGGGDANANTPKRSLWGKVAKTVEDESVDAHIETLSKNPTNVKSLTRLGTVCFEKAEMLASSQTTKSNQLYFVTAVVLQRAANLIIPLTSTTGTGGEKKRRESVAKLEEAEKGDFPWKALATAHMRSYLMQGVKGDRYHLENSKVAWVRALKSLKNATNPNNLLASAAVSQFLGDNLLASKNLAQIVENFPKIDKIGAVQFQNALVLKQLRNYKEAVGSIQKAMTKGLPHPYNALDAVFIMGRIYENWAVEEEDKEQMSHKAYYKVFNSLKKEKALEGDFDFDNWINDGLVWLGLAEKAGSAGHYGLACDLFECALERLEEDEGGESAVGLILFELAKATYRCGDLSGAMGFLERAIDGEGGGGGGGRKGSVILAEMNNIMDVWAGGTESKIVSLVKFPSKKFMDRLLLLLPGDL